LAASVAARWTYRSKEANIAFLLEIAGEFGFSIVRRPAGHGHCDGPEFGIWPFRRAKPAPNAHLVVEDCMANVLEVNHIDDLAQFRLAWNALLPETPGASFFHTLDWLETYWRHFGHDQRLRVLIVRSGGTPVGIVPLCVRREKYRLGTLRVLTYPLDNWATWFGPVGPSPAATMLAAMQHIRRTRRDWDMIDLRWVGPESAERGRTARSMRAANLFCEKREYQLTSIVDLPSTWDEFIAAKSSTLRRQFRRTLKNLFEERGAEFVRHRPAPAREGDGDPRWDLYAMCELTALASWQGSSTNGNTLTHPRVREYCRDAHQTAARLGMVDVNVLLLEGRPAAFLYSYHYQGRIAALRTGYDASAGNDGIGSALALKSIEDSIHRGDELIDFGPGEREHKRRMRTRTESSYRLTYAPIGSLRSQAVRWSRWAKDRWLRRAAS
jgi:CelD/BcsL family acetyltransferase involved in cellulose biosynthesis